MKQMVLKNKMGEIIRVFRCQTEKIFLVYRKNKGRLDFCSSPLFFEKDSIVLVDEWQVNEVNKQEIPLTGGTLEVCDRVDNIRADLPRPSFNSVSFKLVFGWTASAYLTLIIGLYTFSYFKPIEEQMLSEVQQVVKIIKPPVAIKPEKIVIGSDKTFIRNSKEKHAKKPIKKSLKKMGALSVLGSLSKSKQKGGLNLGANKVSAGPGFRTLSSKSSGGIQNQIYSKGMVLSALGAGGNVRGGGGHGTKGTEQGGGSAGYGKLSLIGSGGTEDLLSSSNLNIEGGNFDFSIIDREVVKHIGRIRQCYDKALQMEPNLKGLFKIQFGINTKGKVNFSKVRSDSQTQSSVISPCILGIINQIQFPILLSTDIVIDYAFDLSTLDTKGGA